jgi:hypothetical protein
MALLLAKLPILQSAIALTLWNITEAVSGYPCSPAGKTFTIEMDSGKQI